MDRNYPGNSNTQRTEAKKGKAPKTVTSVVKSAPKAKKKSLGEKFTETFLASDFKDAARSIVLDVLIPDTKGTISEMLKGIIDTMLYGERRGARNRGGGKPASYGYTSYNQYYNGGNQQQNNPPPPPKNTAKPVVEDLVFPERDDAELVMEEMNNNLQQYGAVSVRNYYEMAGRTDLSDYTKERWGWFSLEGASIMRVAEGYLVDLPRPVVID